VKTEQQRPFHIYERAFLEGVAKKLSAPDCERLCRDIHEARVTPNGDFLDVELPRYERPDYLGHHNLPFEGKMHDDEGGLMCLLVNMDQNDRLLALEFIWWENSIAVAPDWSTLEIIPEPPCD
jgi:hypothetical protein